MDVAGVEDVVVSEVASLMVLPLPLQLEAIPRGFPPKARHRASTPQCQRRQTYLTAATKAHKRPSRKRTHAQIHLSLSMAAAALV